jgi:hypothetical protein
MARMIRKPTRARLTSDAALLLLQRIGLLVCHGSGRAESPVDDGRSAAGCAFDD